MTDNQIIKALECLTGEPKLCRGCPYDGTEHYPFCREHCAKDALMLIKRQKAEIEKLTKKQKPTAASGFKVENNKVVFYTNMLGGCRIEYENLEEVVKTLNELLQGCYDKDEIAFHLKCVTKDLRTAKTEAIKKFAERLKEDSRNFFVSTPFLEHIDIVAEHMVGETNEVIQTSNSST